MNGPQTSPDPRVPAGQHPAGVHKDVFLDFLVRKRLKLTRQRQAVVELIFSDSGHFEAEALVERLKIGRTRVSRATVYRTLELLRECQLVEKLDFGTPRSFYEHVPPGEHHDHLICTRCRAIIEFENDKIEHLQDMVAKRHGFHVTDHKLELYGLCEECRGETRA